MFHVKRLHFSRGFWISFAALAALTVYSLFTRVFFIDLLAGLLVILVGLQGLLYEYNQRLLINDRKKIRENFDYIVQWLDNNYSFLKTINTKHENRLHTLDVKRARTDEKLEKLFRDAVRKIIDVENKLNKTIKIVGNSSRHDALAERISKIENEISTHVKSLEKEAIRGQVRISRRQRAVLRHVRRKNSITTRDYMTYFGVKRETALKELHEMVERNLLRRAGKGRASRYELGF